MRGASVGSWSRPGKSHLAIPVRAGHNVSVIPLSRKFILTFTALQAVLSAGGSVALADDNSTAQEFQIKQEYMNDRVNDFYRRLDELDRQDQARESSAGEMKKYRSELKTEHEKARAEYVKQRQAKPKEDPAAWEKEIAERKRVYDLTRKEFVRRRDIFNKENKSFDSIPPEEELGIEPEENK
jgi:hypothetical protein